MALPNNKQSEFAKHSLDSLNDQEEENNGLHIEIDRRKLKPIVKPTLSGHQWVQRGPYLVCRSCPIEHAVYIGMNVRLIGFKDNGRPILKKIGKRG